MVDKDTKMYGEKIINLMSQFVSLHADLLTSQEISDIADGSDAIERAINRSR